uniref:Mitochondrial GTPase 1 n=1 Tax=Spongospora subterranea TaxID=70186 RepID=A0A0H5R9V2_9EUKA|eukprot:CRZ10566.1 hypothetical protein [Spongospora subterranea]
MASSTAAALCSKNLSWFPGHMSKAILDLTSRQIARSHIIIEVRDARLPISSSNRELLQLVKSKRSIILFNKSDLADLSSCHRDKIFSYIQRESTEMGVPMPILQFLSSGPSSMSRSDRQKLITHITKTLRDKSRFKTTSRLCMVVGIPNIGKSSILSGLRQCSKSFKIGPEPGVTRSIHDVKIRAESKGDPDIVFQDSPGILPPSIDSAETALKLSLINAIPSSVLGHGITAQYLFEIMYSQTDNTFEEYLTAEAVRHSYYVKPGQNKHAELDISRVARCYVEEFRKGRLGRYMLDEFEVNTDNQIQSNSCR